jgi:hypothetical protein
MNAQSFNIRLSYDVSLQDRGDHWAAIVEQIGTTVYAQDEQAALKRADEMVQFIVSSFNKYATLDDFREYMDSHGLQHTITKAVGAENYDLGWFSPYRREGAFAFA